MDQLNVPVMAKDILRSFGRVKGRIISERQQAIIKELLPKFLLPTNITKLDAIFPASIKKFSLEIGSGSGEFTIKQARDNSDVGFIACEPYLNGLSVMVQNIDKAQLNNIRLWRGDGRILLKQLPQNIFSQAFILFPDPWPKTKHHKKRLITTQFLDNLSSAIENGGSLLIATDHADYFAFIMEQIKLCKVFKLENKNEQEFDLPPDYWIKTRYQEKAEKAGRKGMFIRLTKLV